MQITTSSTTIALTDGSSHGAAPREVSKKTLWGAAALVAILYGSLWSPHWYPLSDSALYLSLGKSLAHGDGFQFLGESHRLAAPLTPIMIAVAMRLGGDFGTLHALMIGLMLIGLLLAYLTLKQWVGQRAALGATVAASLSFWVAQCVTTIMTEPLCMALLWGMMLALTLAARAQKRWRRGWLFALAIFLLLAGFENRVAMILLLPGIVVAIWWSAEFASRKERLVWIGCFCFVLGTAFWDYRYGGHSVDFISQASARVRSDSVEVPPMPDSRAVVPPATPNSSLMEAGAAPTVGSAVSASEKQFGTPSAHRIEKSIPKAYARQNSRYGVTLPPVSTMSLSLLFWSLDMRGNDKCPRSFYFKQKNFGCGSVVAGRSRFILPRSVAHVGPAPMLGDVHNHLQPSHLVDLVRADYSALHGSFRAACFLAALARRQLAAGEVR